MKNSLLDIVLTQARHAFEALRSDDGSDDGSDADRERQLDDLFGAALLVGDDDLEDEVRAISQQIVARAPAGVESLAKLIESLQSQLPPLSEAAISEFAEDAPTTALPRTVPEGDTSLAGVRRPSRRNRSSFDTGEHLILSNIFREEAREGLERITEILLASTSAEPDEDQLNELMRLTHGLKGAAGTVDLPRIASVAHEYETIFERIRNGGLAWSNHTRDDLVEIADGLHLSIANADGPEHAAPGVAPLRERLAQIGTFEPGGPASSEIKTDEIAETHSEQTYAERRRPERRGTDNPMLRVDPDRIDRLMNCVGELVFDRSRIEKRVGKLTFDVAQVRAAMQTLSDQRAYWVKSGTPIRGEQFGSALSALEGRLSEIMPTLEHELSRLGEDTALLRRTEFALQDGLTAVRMQSVRSLFGRLTPQLRAIARQADKKVRLVTAGGETEFDKTVADQLVDPLIQLLRNAVAHGIEAPLDRESRGKSAEGRIMMTARHEGNVFMIEVSDDGAGIHTDDLRRRFVEAGHWTASQAAQASDERTLQLIFDAGFSSRSTTDQLAGRGMGLSAVRETVTRLGGEVLVSSQQGLGTHFTMRLPLTTAVANALLFKIGGHVFAIPNVHVLDQGEIELPLRDTAPDADGQDLPMVPLHDLLGFPMPESLQRCPVVLLEFMGKRLAISCDRIIGTREIIVKNLGPMLSGVTLYAGGTVSPSGKVQLILDPAALVGIAYPGPPVQHTPAPLAEPDPPVSKRILVVDDSKAIREAMRRMLVKAGYDVATASDGAEAFECLQEHDFSIMVTDLEMPGEDGFTLLTRASEHIRRTNLKVLVISSKATEENRKRATSLGAADFLAKPVQQQRLIDALRATQRNS
ncbi:MAG: response regulator [Myxococcales bacterium]|nr:response regulator [Myxococcales bacterium]